ncbi:Polygalacturonase precursor [Clavibacter michiganensis]|uniref:Polygalacturonase n=1 Tax=Clavibacter michiganensis TaxID=28447 RepID=A0A251YNJ6_9MICO|nr:glycosyl hydrolase family 28 protein [Clavibacter michiganensis]OUE25826.1 Polygalacturonase precursor [Clavibacter michiganensis]
MPSRAAARTLALTAVVAGTLAAVMLAGPAALASHPAAARTPTPATAAQPAAQRAAATGGTGDRRTVTEPVDPTTTCATVAAQLDMPDRSASAADERAAPDTARIQAALDSCAQSSTAVVTVRLASSSRGASFLSGPLQLRQGETLVLDPSVTLFGSRNPADYQVAGQPTCGTVGGSGKGCAALITAKDPHAGVSSRGGVDARRGRIDGRGDQAILGGTTTWWQLAEQARGGGAQNEPRLILATGADDFTLHDVDLVDAATFHVSFHDGVGLTVWGVRIQTPATARNTDGIDPSGATDVTIAHSYVSDGDDGIAIKGGTHASSHITVTDSHFYGTHGISIGSEVTTGVSDVLVTGSTVSGTDAYGTASVSSAGLRIKSNPSVGGAVTGVTYRDVCLTRTSAPLQIDPRYAGGSGSSIPSFSGIVIDGLRAVDSPAKAVSTLAGYDGSHRLGISLARVDVDAPAVTAAYADIATAGASFGGSPLSSTRADVHVTASASVGAAPTCAFPAFPLLPGLAPAAP